MNNSLQETSTLIVSLLDRDILRLCLTFYLKKTNKFGICNGEMKHMHRKPLCIDFRIFKFRWRNET